MYCIVLLVLPVGISAQKQFDRYRMLVERLLYSMHASLS